MNDTYAAKEITAALLDVLKPQGLCLKEALRLIEKAEEMAKSIHVPMVITVVDQGGNMVAMHRMVPSWPAFPYHIQRHTRQQPFAFRPRTLPGISCRDSLYTASSRLILEGSVSSAEDSPL